MFLVVWQTIHGDFRIGIRKLIERHLCVVRAEGTEDPDQGEDDNSEDQSVKKHRAKTRLAANRAARDINIDKVRVQEPEADGGGNEEDKEPQNGAIVVRRHGGSVALGDRLGFGAGLLGTGAGNTVEAVMDIRFRTHFLYRTEFYEKK